MSPSWTMRPSGSSMVATTHTPPRTGRSPKRATMSLHVPHAVEKRARSSSPDPTAGARSVRAFSSAKALTARITASNGRSSAAAVMSLASTRGRRADSIWRPDRPSWSARRARTRKVTSRPASAGALRNSHLWLLHPRPECASLFPEQLGVYTPKILFHLAVRGKNLGRFGQSHLALWRERFA